ncbi:MAG: hypothetical protein Q8L85_01290 [Alphaproteobacteria bacterium]|nr:hypothetical protein [Alphaproteobacteria bacterium]
MLKKLVLLVVVCMFFSNSFVFANHLDKTFTGDVLVVGGLTKNDPDKLSINICRADIIGSGWDTELLEQLTPNKYNHVLFEHVGMSMYQPVKDSEYCMGVAKAYFNLLTPGGSFDFLSWGYFFDDEAYPMSYYLRTDDAPRVVISYDPKLNYGTFDLDKESIDLRSDLKEKLLKQVKGNGYITATVQNLANAGFVDIKIQREENGVLGFTRSHGSLHVSARKPII